MASPPRTSPVKQTIFYALVLVGYIKNNLDVANTLNLDSTAQGAPKVRSSPL